MPTGTGLSQSGRFLRHFLYLALNEDEEGRIVFDGLIPHVAGGRRGEFNQRFGQPSTPAKRSMGNLFPFTDTEQTDPETGKTDGLLSRLSARGEVPKTIFTNTSAEYWRGDGSLIHTDAEGTRDVAPSESVRIYCFAGTHHPSGFFPLTDTHPMNGHRGERLLNSVDYTPLVRAAVVALDRWVTSGEPPPPSRYPRICDGTLVPPEQTESTFKSIPGVRFPAHPPRTSRLDFGPGAEAGVPSMVSPVVGKAYRHLVSAGRRGWQRAGWNSPARHQRATSYSHGMEPTPLGHGRIRRGRWNVYRTAWLDHRFPGHQSRAGCFGRSPSFHRGAI